MAEMDEKCERVDLSSLESSLQLDEVRPSTTSLPTSLPTSLLGTTLMGRFKVKDLAPIVLWTVLGLAYNVYLAYAIHYHAAKGRTLDWCGGLGFLIVLTSIVYLGLFYFYVVKWAMRRWRLQPRLPASVQKMCHHRFFKLAVSLVIFIAILVFLIVDTEKDRYRTVELQYL